ncbi:MAG: T9SS type A sorting domain-containing protein [Bacteroidetes bacterium]|nr:T9SS type A sorting domain-containing protein [Bacteroidota bacterium]
MANAIFAQTVQWADFYTTNTDYDEAYAVTAGGDARIYVAGYTATTKAMLISYLAGGTRNWVKTYAPANSPYLDRYNVVNTFGSGTSIHIYAAGTHEANTTNSYDAIISKYDQSGNLISPFPVLWNRSGGGDDKATLIALDASENIYICGTSSQNGGDIIIVKYNSSGVKQWETSYNSSGIQNDVPTFMKLSGSYLYISGITTVSSPNTVAFVKKVDISNGSVVWTYPFDNNSTDADNLYALDVLTLQTGKYIYAVGSTKNSTLDAVLLKIDDTGSLLCHDYYDGPNALSDEFYSIATQAPTNGPEIYVTGGSQTSSSCATGWDYTTIRYNDCATRSWVKSYPGHNPTCGCPAVTTKAKMILISPYSGKIFVTGDTYCYVNGMDESTVRYTPSNGTQEWADTYDRGFVNNVANQTADKFPMAIGATNNCGSEAVYITGWSQESSSSGKDATTYQYDVSCCPGCGGPSGGRYMTPNEPTRTEKEISVAGLYPNPFSQSATFKFAGETIYPNSSLIVYDMFGKEMKRIENINTNEVQINRDEMKSGIYYYRCIQGENVLSSGKFIITN